MKMHIKYIATIFAALLVANSALGENVSGDISAKTITANTTWELTGNVNLTGTITVNAGVTLTIKGNNKIITTYTTTTTTSPTNSFLIKDTGTLTLEDVTLDGGNTGTIVPENQIGEGSVQTYSGFTKAGVAIMAQDRAKVTLTRVTAKNLYGGSGTAFTHMTNSQKTSTSTDRGIITMESCTVTNCYNSNDGGIIYQSGGSDMHGTYNINNTNISHCMVIANSTGTGYGGVIKGPGSTDCNLNMTSSSMSYCWGSAWGGAILWAANLNGCKAVFNSCNFHHNYARYLGGAISSEATVELYNCTLEYNTAGYGGGALAAFPFTLTETTGEGIDNSTAIGLQLTGNTIRYNKTLYSTNKGGLNVPDNIRAKENNQNQGVHLELDGYFNPRYTVLNATDVYYPTGGGGIWVLMNKDGWNCNLNIGSNDIHNNESANNAGGVLLFKQTPYRRAESGESEYVKDLERVKFLDNYSMVGDNRTGITTMTIGANIYANTTNNSGGGIAVGASENTSSTWTLPSVTLNGGTIYENSAKDGAGIYMPGGNFTVNGGTIYENTASNNGGGVYLTTGIFKVNSQKEFSAYGNTATNSGGGIYLGGGEITIEGKATFNSNKATNGNGGGLYLGNGSFTVSQSGTLNLGKQANYTIGNNAKGLGGGVYCAAPFIVHGTSAIQYNSANDGGGVYVTGNNNILFDGSTTLSYNNAGNYGGALYVTTGSITFNGASTINNNTAKGRGGAAYVFKGRITTAADYLTTISGNTVTGDDDSTTNDSGGAFYIEGASTSDKGYLNLQGNTTVTENSAITNGGAITINKGDVNISGASTTFSKNHAMNGGAVFVYEGDFKITNSSSESKTILQENTCSNNGGALYVTGGSIEINNPTTMLKNTASKNGGVAYVSNGRVTLKANTTMSNNTATGGSGGVFYVQKEDGYTGTVGVETSIGTMESNTSGANGGVFYVNGGNITLGGATTMSQNSAVNGGAIALQGGTFTIHNQSSIKNNTATGNGGGLWVKDPNEDLSCVGGSFVNNTAGGNGGGLYASGNKIFTFAANVQSNKAKNGAGIYIDGGMQLQFGQDGLDNGLIVGNIAEAQQNGSATVDNTSDVVGVGGGIYLNNGKLQFMNASKLGVYNNSAKYEAADIYASGNNTTIILPNTKNMNLTGFDVPGNELYWVYDVYGNRYEDALLDMNKNIPNRVNFGNTQLTQEVTSKICLDLGYDLVFVTITPDGLSEIDNAMFVISYPQTVTNTNNGVDTILVPYRTVTVAGERSTIVGLPSGDWNFEVTQWNYLYDAPSYAYYKNNSTTPEDLGSSLYPHITREGITSVKATFARKPIPGTDTAPTIIYHNAKVVNKMKPKDIGNSSSSSPTTPTTTTTGK